MRLNNVHGILNFNVAVTGVLTPIIFDIIPVSLILYIHSRNFKTLRFIGNEKTIDEFDDSEVKSTHISYDLGSEQRDSKSESSLEDLI